MTDAPRAAGMAADSLEIIPVEPSSPGGKASRWLHWMVPPLFGVALVLFLRCSDFFVRPQFWGEDADILYRDARYVGWGCLFAPFPSYYIVAQRLVACLTAYLPALFAPWAYCYAALGYTLLTAWFCLRARLAYLMDRRGRIALALALALTPHSGEVFMKLINAQWMLMPILLILILQEQPASPRQGAVDFAGLLLAGMSGPFVALYAPWFLVRFRKVTGGWSRYNLSLVATAWGLTAVQILALWQGPLLHAAPGLHPRQWPKEFGVLLPGGLFFGEFVPTLLPRAFFVISPLLLAWLGWALWRGERERRWAALTLLGCGATAYLGGVRTEAADLLSKLVPFGAGARYFYPFYTFAIWSAIIFCFDLSRRLRAAAGAALVMMLLASASHFASPPWPNFHWESYAARLDAGEAVNGIPILPGWHEDYPVKKK